MLLVLTGASGAGKTTLARGVETALPRCRVFYFDSLGVPSAAEMRAFGDDAGEAWQRAMTWKWMERLAPLAASAQPVLLEGQIRIAFVREAAAAYGMTASLVVLEQFS